MRFRFAEEHRSNFPTNRLCGVVGVSTRGLRAFRSRPANRRQRPDLVTLAQSRLSLGSYGQPRMTEELKETDLNVGHRRVDRPLSADLALPNRLLGNRYVRTAYLSCERVNIRWRLTAIINSTSRPTYWIGTFAPTNPIKNGRATSAMSGHVRVGCILR